MLILFQFRSLNPSKIIAPMINMSANTLMKARSNRENPFCMILTILLINKKLNKQGIQILQRLGITMSYSAVWDFFGKLSKSVSIHLKDMFDSTESLKNQFLVIDNINIAQKVIGDTTGMLNWTMGVTAEIYRR